MIEMIQRALIFVFAVFFVCAAIPHCAWSQPPVASTPAGWQANPKVEAELAEKNIAWVYREQDVQPYAIPDPLKPDGKRQITDRSEWEQSGRSQTLELFRTHVYGRAPDKPADLRIETVLLDSKAIDGSATHKRVKIVASDGGKSFAFEASLIYPNNRTGKLPTFLLINNRPIESADPSRKQQNDFWPVEQIVARGFATAVFNTYDVDPDKDGPDARSQGVRGVWPAGGGTPVEDAWGTIAAWAWGAQRVMDWLVTEPAIDGQRIALVGHSRGGKTSLWAGAQDARFSLVISNESGCAGAALSKRVYGETVATINHNFPYWFCDNFKQYDDREAELPIDQHQLLALIAPRALYVASADADLWADPRGEFLGLANAGPAYALYGLPGFRADEMPPLDTPLVRDQVAYHVRRGNHNLTLYDWRQFMDFAGRL
jgi:hypothetical protein